MRIGTVQYVNHYAMEIPLVKFYECQDQVAL